jgi:hypothetical protein
LIGQPKLAQNATASLGRNDLERIGKREAVHKLAVLGVNIDVAMKVEPPSVHITSYAVTCLHQRRSHDGIIRHVEAFRVDDMIDAVPKMKEVFRHRALPIVWSEQSELIAT